MYCTHFLILMYLFFNTMYQFFQVCIPGSRLWNVMWKGLTCILGPIKVKTHIPNRLNESYKQCKYNIVIFKYGVFIFKYNTLIEEIKANLNKKKHPRREVNWVFKNLLEHNKFKHNRSKYKEIELEISNSNFIMVRHFLAYIHSPQAPN